MDLAKSRDGPVPPRHDTEAVVGGMARAEMAHEWNETVFQVDALRDLFGYNRSMRRPEEN